MRCADLFVDGIDLRQTQGGNEGADQARPRQVDAFAEGATQYGEAYALAVQRKAGQELCARSASSMRRDWRHTEDVRGWRSSNRAAAFSM